MLSTCAKICKLRKASLMLQFSILRLCLLVAKFIACCNTADNLFKEFELKSGPTKFWARSESELFETQIDADLLLFLLLLLMMMMMMMNYSRSDKNICNVFNMDSPTVQFEGSGEPY